MPERRAKIFGSGYLSGRTPRSGRSGAVLGACGSRAPRLVAKPQSPRFHHHSAPAAVTAHRVEAAWAERLLHPRARSAGPHDLDKRGAELQPPATQGRQVQPRYVHVAPQRLGRRRPPAEQAFQNREMLPLEKRQRALSGARAVPFQASLADLGIRDRRHRLATPRPQADPDDASGLRVAPQQFGQRDQPPASSTTIKSRSDEILAKARAS